MENTNDRGNYGKDNIEKLNINNFSNEIKSISIGKLSHEMIKFIISKKPEYEERLKKK